VSLAARRLAIIGGGWAGMAAAVEAVGAGRSVTVFEAGRMLGGRARAMPATLPDGRSIVLDNGQHILIGAYTECLRLMGLVGIDPASTLMRMPMRLEFPDGRGLRLPDWPAPLDALAGIAGARGWTIADRWSLLRQSLAWRAAGFRCAPDQPVSDLCHALTPRILAELIDPLCVSALNMPPADASGQVFLRVLQDALFGVRGASHLLLPRVDLSALFPRAAAGWITARGSEVRTGARVQAQPDGRGGWRVDGRGFDAVVIATAPTDAVRQIAALAPALPAADQAAAGRWIATTEGLRHTAITTVYAWAAQARLARPMLALRSGGAAGPAQFVFDRGQLGGPAGLLAFVISASGTDRDAAERQTLEQARRQLGLALQPVRTVVEKRATFACTPGVRRPPPEIVPGLRACGDHVAGPYPATLEAAVRSGVAAIR